MQSYIFQTLQLVADTGPRDGRKLGVVAVAQAPANTFPNS